MSENIQGLLKIIDNYNQEKDRLKNSSLEGERLFSELCYENPKTKEGWFELRDKVHAFLNADNPEVEKKRLMQYTEMLAMIINGYKYEEENSISQ